MSGIKIRMVNVDGQMRIPPECMRLLKDFGEHTAICDECGEAFKSQRMTYCATGLGLLRELGEQPEVKPNANSSDAR